MILLLIIVAEIINRNLQKKGCKNKFKFRREWRRGSAKLPQQGGGPRIMQVNFNSKGSTIKMQEKK